jgi:hypothetical protein
MSEITVCGRLFQTAGAECRRARPENASLTLSYCGKFFPVTEAVEAVRRVGSVRIGKVVSV